MGWIVLFGAVVSLCLVWLDHRERRRAPNLDPSCGKCGYCVRGIPTFICPECGSDLRDVGIIVPSRLRKFLIRPFTRVLMWTALVPLPILVALDWLTPVYLPQRSVVRSHPFIQCKADYLNVTLPIALEGDAFTVGQSRRVEFSTMIIRVSGKDRPLVVDLASNGYSFTDADGKQVDKPGGFGAVAIGQWLASHGFDARGSPLIPDRCIEIAGAIDALLENDVAELNRISPYNPMGRRYFPPQSGPIVTASQGGRTVQSSWVFLTPVVLFGVPIALWAIGTRAILRRAKKTVAPVPAAA